MNKTDQLLLFVIILLQMGAVVFLNGAVPTVERQALIALYSNTNGDNWAQKSGWLGAAGTEAAWFGVTVRNISGTDHVTSISLVHNNLRGSIPPEIVGLSRLEYLALDNNNLYGAVPTEISKLANLKRLVLDFNRLSGGIPKEIGELRALGTLGLNYNELAGNIPAELGQLIQLQKLRLASNRLIGSIPGQLTQLLNLTSLDIGYNGLYTGNQALRDFLDAGAPGWETTQTTAPGGLEVIYRTGSSLLAIWTPIVFTGYEGYYEILYRIGQQGEEYISLGNTATKSDASLVIDNFDMIPGTTYYFVVRTKTLPHQYNFNSVLSEESGEFPYKMTVYTLTVRSAPGDGAYITAAPLDKSGEGNGAAPFERFYFPDTEVALTAPRTLDGNPFRKWELAGNGDYFNRQVKITMDADYTLTAVYKQPEIILNRWELNFSGTTAGVKTPAQEFLLGNRGGGTLDWTISVDIPAEISSWLTAAPASGSCSGNGSEFIKVSLDLSGLDPGTYEGSIAVIAPDASNSPQTIPVTLLVKDEEEDQPPFGAIETPGDYLIISGGTAVTGWVLDDIGVESVKIYRSPALNNKNKNDLIYIGDADFVEGARPDVELAYPGYPMNYKAGWGYMMLTNFFHDGNNEPGDFHIIARAVDQGGNEVTLGARTIRIDNKNAVKPFGAIDTPGQGGEASGAAYRNQGWVLAPPPGKIPEDGSTIMLYVDGKKVTEGAVYDIFRWDIANLFPGYKNSEGALAYFDLDTGAYPNGIHTLQWVAADDRGNIEGIGSRYFTIRNTGNSEAGTAQSAGEPAAMFITRDSSLDLNNNMNPDLAKIPAAATCPARVIKGFHRDVEPRIINPDRNGNMVIEIKELERVEIHFNDYRTGVEVKAEVREHSPGNPKFYAGYLVVGGQLRPLPLGSGFDHSRGIFYWQPGPGFYGGYELVFFKIDKDKAIQGVPVNIRILPGQR